jgi:hypothetical protein
MHADSNILLNYCLQEEVCRAFKDACLHHAMKSLSVFYQKFDSLSILLLKNGGTLASPLIPPPHSTPI